MGEPRSQLILVTGGSGFVGSHILQAFLDAGYKVRAAVRTEKNAQKVLQSHLEQREQLEFSIGPDITKPGAFDDAVHRALGVVHSASPFVIDVQDNGKDLLQPAIQGTTGILRSVTACGPSVKHVVVTSSFAAVNDFSKSLRPGYVYTEADWNPITYEAQKEASGQLAYG